MLPPTSSAQPKSRAHFDTWNSSSTGHQRAENKLGGSTEWRQSRNMKLSHQFKSESTGGKRISNQVGAGSKDWDEKAKALVPQSARERAKRSVHDMLVGRGPLSRYGGLRRKSDIPILAGNLTAEIKGEERRNRLRGVFDGLVIYINGSTSPLIGDHKLKHLLAENGAKLSLHLGRRQVTHVILGRPSADQGAGAGGGLAGPKITKEIRRIGGCGLKYVGVEWVLESVKAGIRLPETPFATLKVAPKAQQSVYSMFKKSSSMESSESAF